MWAPPCAPLLLCPPSRPVKGLRSEARRAQCPEASVARELGPGPAPPGPYFPRVTTGQNLAEVALQPVRCPPFQRGKPARPGRLRSWLLWGPASAGILPAWQGRCPVLLQAHPRARWAGETSKGIDLLGG